MIIFLKNLFNRNRLLIFILLLIFLALSIYFFVLKDLSQDDQLSILVNPASVIEQRKINLKEEIPINFSLPVNIKIPSINVDAKVEYVGLTKDGAMSAPAGPSETGWFYLGTRPGEEGSSVIDGHSGWKNNIPAVFDNLYKVNIGDKVYVQDDKGKIVTFIVREIKKYDPNADASSVFTSKDGKAHLNLITCTGFWNAILKSHSQRLIVFTDKEN